MILIRSLPPYPFHSFRAYCSPVYVLLAYFLLVPLLLAIGSSQAFASAAEPHAAKVAVVHVQMEHTSLQVLDNVWLGVKYMVGAMVPQPDKVISLDDKSSFLLEIDQAETHLDAKDLSALLNQYLLPIARTQLKNLTIRFNGQTMLIRGEFHKGVDVPFEAAATLGVTRGDIQIHITELKAAALVKKGLLDFLGIKLSTLAQPKDQSVFRIEGDDIILPIAHMFPPPHVTGKLRSIRVAGNQLIQTFGPASPRLQAAPDKAQNYIYFAGGTMRFGKLTMTDVDLELVDKDPSTVFEFSLDHYYRQLEAGYTQTLANRGLRVTLPDYSTVQTQR